MSHFVPESATDYDAVFERGGENHGDEDFALFKCPRCGHVYLMEYEVDTVFIDGKDLSKRVDVTNYDEPFICLQCNLSVPRDGAWVGPKVDQRFQVTWTELSNSPWAWVVRPAQSDGNEI